MSIAVARERAEAREAAEAEKDAPLRADIRLLGRLLGDTVREQEGAEVFAIVERIRQASIRFHRDNEIGARRELEATLDSLDNDQTLSDRARLQLFLAPRQHRRGPAPHPPQPRPRADEVGAASGRAGLRLQARRRRGHRRSRAARVLRPRARQPGAHRPPDRGPAQEHADARAGDRRGCSTSASACRATRSSWRATRSNCAAPSSSCGAPACCDRRG